MNKEELKDYLSTSKVTTDDINIMKKYFNKFINHDNFIEYAENFLNFGFLNDKKIQSF